MTDKIRTVLRWLMGILLIAQGVNHFVLEQFFVSIMPDYLHLSARGYEIWAQAIEPQLKKLLGETE